MIKLSADGLDITIEFLEIDKRVRAHFLFGLWRGHLLKTQIFNC